MRHEITNVSVHAENTNEHSVDVNIRYSREDGQISWGPPADPGTTYRVEYTGMVNIGEPGEDAGGATWAAQIAHRVRVPWKLSPVQVWHS